MDVKKTDLGLSSMFVRSQRPPPLGSTLEITVSHGESCEARMGGHVTRIEGGSRGRRQRGFEVEFAHTDADQTQRLFSILMRLRNEAERLMSETQARARARLEAELERVRSMRPHEVLGVHGTATGPALERAFLTRARQYHPHRYARYDCAQMTDVATQIFVELQRAYAWMKKTARARSSAPPSDSSRTRASIPAMPKGESQEIKTMM